MLSISMGVIKTFNPHQKLILERYKKMAQKLVAKKITPEEFATEQAHIHIYLENQVSYDGLLPRFLNHKGFAKTLEREIKIIKRAPALTGTLLALDIDQLKRFNDTYGHVDGDKLIKTYARVVEKMTRSSDFKGRVGGDELAVFLVNSDAENARIVAERIRKEIIKACKTDFPKLRWEQTASIGVAQVNLKDTVKSLRERADKVLYEAKKSRNTVVVALSDDKSHPTISQSKPTFIQVVDRLKQRVRLTS